MSNLQIPYQDEPSNQREDVPRIAKEWIERFASAVSSGDAEAVAAAFAPEGQWRDLYTLSWEPRTLETADIRPFVNEHLEASGLTAIEFDSARIPPREVDRCGRTTIEAFFRFETRVATGDGVVRLLRDDDVDDGSGSYRAWHVLSVIQALKDHPEQTGRNRPVGLDFSREFGGPNWLDRRLEHIEYRDHQPEVLIIGGGQSGLSIAARLGALGVDALVVDTHERVGDNWRKRYHALTLHNSVWLNDLPYIPNPPTWPVFVPKDKLANWFESYAEALEINFWTSATVKGASYNDEKGEWTVELVRDGVSRSMTPKHLVVATGISGAPKPVDYPGLNDFGGTWFHSSKYQSGHDYEGRRAVVFGTGTSGHDVAQDLHQSGCDVTIVQRGPTTVTSVLPGVFQGDLIYHEGNPVEDTDLLASSIPYHAYIVSQQILTSEVQELDAEMLDGLRQIGLKLDFGEDGTGHALKYMRRGGGYYLDVGCAQLLIDGEIGLVSDDDVDRLVEGGLLMSDGTVLAADVIAFAFGFQPLHDSLRPMLGDAVADRIGPIWDYDDGGEIRNTWRPTAQPGLWFMGGNFAQCRFYSRRLALQIKADIEGMRK